MKKTLQTAGGVLAFILTLIIPVIFLGGAIRFFSAFGEKLGMICSWTIVGTFVLLLLSPIRILRAPIATLIFVCTFIWGAFAWLYSAYVTYILWGAFAVLFGLLMASLGVLPMALVALMFHRQFADAGYLLLLFALVAGFRLLSPWLASKGGCKKQVEPEHDLYLTARSGE